jgi:hypothetical protein
MTGYLNFRVHIPSGKKAQIFYFVKCNGLKFNKHRY